MPEPDPKPPCYGLRELGGEYVECDQPAEWLVGTTPACSECIATFLKEEAPTLVTPIGSPAIIVPVYTLTPMAIKRIAAGFAHGMGEAIRTKVPQGLNGGEISINEESIALKVEAAIVGEAKRTVVEVESFLATARQSPLWEPPMEAP